MRHMTSADYHLGHSKILEYSKRPFKTSEEMNEYIIARHNERVHPDDMFYFLGDFCFKHPLTDDEIAGGRPTKAEQWLARLNGIKVLIQGNHDKSGGVKTIIQSMKVEIAHTRIHLTHKPEHSDPSVQVNLCGHVHRAWRIRYFKEHYKIIEDIVAKNADLPSDRQDLRNFLERNYEHRNSDSVLLNVGVDVQRYMPISLDEALGQVIRFRKGIVEK